MKKFIFLALLATFAMSYAESSEDIKAVREKWTQEYFAKKGMPIPDGGVKVIPEQQMASYEENKEEKLKNKADIEKLGYINRSSPRAFALLTIHITAAHQLKKQQDNYNPTSTHIRPSINDLKMAYTFVGVPQNQGIEIIGVSPYLTYLKGQGWVGATQFFKKEGIGNCAFSENNVRLSHGSVIIAKEDARNDVNDKTTTVEVVGNQQTGFVYDVEWYDNTFFRQLECANKQYSQNITNNVIELAKNIDSNQ